MVQGSPPKGCPDLFLQNSQCASKRFPKSQRAFPICCPDLFLRNSQGASKRPNQPPISPPIRLPISAQSDYAFTRLCTHPTRSGIHPYRHAHGQGRSSVAHCRASNATDRGSNPGVAREVSVPARSGIHPLPPPPPPPPSHPHLSTPTHSASSFIGAAVKRLDFGIERHRGRTPSPRAAEHGQDQGGSKRGQRRPRG